MKKLLLKLRTAIGKKKAQGNLKSFASAKKIGILLNNPDFSQNQYINEFVNHLTGLGKEVEVLCFLDKEVNRLYEFSYIEMRQNDINLTGGFKSEKVNKFIKTRFDYLYSINISPFLPFEYILTRSPDAVKIGKYFPGSDKYLDIMIDIKERANLRDLLNKMVKLISNLSFHD